MTILCYHAVDPDWDSPLAVMPAAFAAQMEWLAGHRRIIPLSEALSSIDATGRTPRGTAVVTFDDGFASIYEHAFAVLARLGIPSTMFLVAETLTATGHPVDWVDDPPTWELRTLDAAQIAEMAAAGMTFASHSAAHRDLTTLSESECREDLGRSREILEGVLGHDVGLLAYPRGRHDEQVRRAAADSGFTHGFALPAGPESGGRLAIRRIGVYRGNSLAQLRVKAARWYPVVRTSRSVARVRRALRVKPPDPT